MIDRKSDRMRYRATLLLLGIVLSAISGRAQTTQTSSLVSGGATEASGGDLIVRGSLGQPVIGLTGSPTIQTGQGFWFTVGQEGSSGVEESWVVGGRSGALRLECLPNPVTTVARFQITLPEAGEVTLRLYDQLGRVKVSLIDGKREQGNLLLEVDTEALESGIYTAELRVGTERTTTSVIILN